MKRESGPVCLWFVRCGLLVLTLTAMLLRAQEPPQPDETGAAPADGPPVTVDGVIVNATTGNPLSGALVKIEVSDGIPPFVSPPASSEPPSSEPPGSQLPGSPSPITITGGTPTPTVTPSPTSTPTH